MHCTYLVDLLLCPRMKAIWIYICNGQDMHTNMYTCIYFFVYLSLPLSLFVYMCSNSIQVCLLCIHIHIFVFLWYIYIYINIYMQRGFSVFMSHVDRFIWNPATKSGLLNMFFDRFFKPHSSSSANISILKQICVQVEVLDNLGTQLRQLWQPTSQ